MTLIAAPIMVRDIHAALSDGEDAVQRGARLIEWRVDEIADDHSAVARLVNDAPAPCIVTCRPAAHGGSFDGDESDRIALFEYLGVHARPRYIDLELEALEATPAWRERLPHILAHPDQMREGDTRLIVSTHDFDGRPRDLYQRLERMAAFDDASILKVAWRARSVRDNLEAFELLGRRAKPMIALTMGEFGLMSRVLAPKFGGFLTFASVRDESATAPGQPTIDALRDRYRFDAITPATRVFGVIGWPVAQSLSPLVHNAAFDERELDAVYLPLPVAPSYESFKATVDALARDASLDFGGVSVTLPHKTHLLEFVDAMGGVVDEVAREVGAANTLVVRSGASGDGRDGDCEGGALEARNTDVAALVESIAEALEVDLADLAERRVAVIGAGGAARAAIAGLSRLGATVVVYNRTFERAEALAAEFAAKPTDERDGGPARRVVAARVEKFDRACADIIINATPAGMAGGDAADALPIPNLRDATPACWGADTLVFDTIYTPRETPFLRIARDAGCRTRDGLDMFARQAAAQFELWTGQPAPITRMRAALEQETHQDEEQ
ncbi:MAG: type I 3-dehydroquinate dehydratase [Phycisphaerales bacterium]